MGEWSSFADSHLNLQKAIKKIGDDTQADIEKSRIEHKIKTLENENELLKNLLSKPFKEIAEVNGNFRETYEKQQDILADWILSQQAFKETATQLGIELGKSKDEIKQIFLENEIAVLENRTEHNNNADKYPTLAERREKILSSKKVRK